MGHQQTHNTNGSNINLFVYDGITYNKLDDVTGGNSQPHARFGMATYVFAFGQQRRERTIQFIRNNADESHGYWQLYRYQFNPENLFTNAITVNNRDTQTCGLDTQTKT